MDGKGNGREMKWTGKEMDKKTLRHNTGTTFTTLGVRDLKNCSYLVLKQLLLVQFSQGEHTFPSKMPY